VSQWDYVAGAYAVTALTMILLVLASWRAMRSAEVAAAAVGSK